MSGEVTVRPLHLTPIGKEKVPTPADKNFQKYVKDSNNKKTLSKSYVQYRN